MGFYVVEDIKSFNGTYVNNQRVQKTSLRDGDIVLIGKHTVHFQIRARVHDPPRDLERMIASRVEWTKNKRPQLDHTMVLDTKRVREMLGKKAPTSSLSPIRTRRITAVSSARTDIGQRRIGSLRVVAGYINQRQYLLLSKLNVIGKSEMASIRLKRWFAPQIAASIHQREDGYFLVGAGRRTAIRINGTEMTDAKHELKAGDEIEVAGITAIFDYQNSESV